MAAEPIFEGPPVDEVDRVEAQWASKRAQRALEKLRAGLDAVAEVALDQVPTEVLGDVVIGLQKAVDRTQGEQSRWLRAFDRRSGWHASGATSVGAWLSEATAVAPGAAQRQAEDARVLDRHLPAVRDAFVRGDIGAGQASVIAREAREPRRLKALQQVQDQLVEAAAQLPPAELGRQVRQLEAEEDPEAATDRARRMYEARRLQFFQRRDGMWRIDGELDPVGGDVLKTALNALRTPEPKGTPPEARRSTEQRDADALVDVAKRSLESGDAPHVRKVRPQVTVVVTEESLRERLGGDLGWSGPVAGETIRKVCCDAGIVRAVTDAASQVLDVGRATRTPPLPLRRAVEARDRGCRFGNCRRPPSWCDAHHIVHWSDDGPTDLDNLILLCDHHHNLVHHGGWKVELHPDNSATFTSPKGESHTTQPGGQRRNRHTEPAP